MMHVLTKMVPKTKNLLTNHLFPVWHAWNLENQYSKQREYNNLPADLVRTERLHLFAQGGTVIPGSKDHLIDQRDNDAFKLFRKFIAREKLGNVIYGQQRESDPSLIASSETSGQ